MIDKYYSITNYSNYTISRDGFIRQKNTNILLYNANSSPIRVIGLKRDDNYFVIISVDKLVMNTFVGELENRIGHKDGDYSNNKCSNLYYIINSITNDKKSNIIIIDGIKYKKHPTFNHYYISENGIIYSTFKNTFIIKTINDDGYYRISGHEDKKKTLFIHRMVYETYVGKIPKDMDIHHRNGKKWCNHYTNLSPLTKAENIRDAHNTGLRDGIGAKWKEEDIHIICKMMEQNISSIDIGKQFNICDKKDILRFSRFCYKIRSKRIWKDISSQYDLSKYNSYEHLTERLIKISPEDVRAIRQLSKTMSMTEIAKMYHVTISCISDILNSKHLIRMNKL
jgi:hypothetical protein